MSAKDDYMSDYASSPRMVVDYAELGGSPQQTRGINSPGRLPRRNSTLGSQLVASFLFPPKPQPSDLLTNINVWMYVTAATVEVTVIKAIDVFTDWPDLPFLLTFFLNLYFPIQFVLWQRANANLQKQAEDLARSEDSEDQSLIRDAERARLPFFWRWGALFGVLGFGKTLFKVIGLQNVTAVTYLMLRGTLSFWTALIAWPLTGRFPDMYTTLAILCQFGAIFLIVSPDNFSIFDPDVDNTQDSANKNVFWGAAFTIGSTLLSALNDVIVDKVLDMPRYKMEQKINKRVIKGAISTWASAVPLILSAIAIIAPITGEFAYIQEWSQKPSAIVFLCLSLSLPFAKGVDRYTKYAVIDTSSAFMFQLVEGLRSSCDVILVGILFGDELKWHFFVAILLYTLAAVIETSGKDFATKYCCAPPPDLPASS